MDSQKTSNLIQTATLLATLAMLGFMVYMRIYPNPEKAPTIEGGSLMRSLVSGYGWGPPIVVGVMLLLMFIVRQITTRRGAKPQTESKDHDNASLEILSPFDNEEIGLYETIHGRVFPPDQDLQVVVFAGDKWYPQPSVDRRGSLWSVKCQFGNTDSPGGGTYKVAAILGSELAQGMWYSELPSGIARSNIIRLHKRHEITREQELSAALTKSQEEAQHWKNEYDEEHNGALRLKTLNEQYEMQLKKLTSEAEEARREKLDAAGNLHGVETDRNNYRTWFNELAWLNPAIKPQKEDISNHVTVIAARPCLLSLKARVAVIDLVIRNDSFFDIRIKPGTVAGQLSTNGGLLHDPAKAFVDLEHPPIENLKPTEERMFAIIQPLLRTEAEEIEDAIAEGSDGYFWLGSLNIPISVQHAEPLQVDSKPLRMNSDVERVYFREFGSLTFNGEVTTPRELVRDVDALPFPERARIYRELSKAYDESLCRLNEAEDKKDPEELANEAIRRNTNNA